MNKLGQTVMLSILFAVMIFLAGMLFLNFLPDEVTNTRTALGCSDASSISDGTKLTCLITDGVIPYFILIILSYAGGTIISRFLI